jgi:hypothetical protein
MAGWGMGTPWVIFIDQYLPIYLPYAFGQMVFEFSAQGVMGQYYDLFVYFYFHWEGDSTRFDPTNKIFWNYRSCDLEP